MRVWNNFLLNLLSFAGVSALLAHLCLASTTTFEQKPGAKVPPGAEFRDETGIHVRLGQYFSKDRPVIVAPVYFGCPGLCNSMLEGLGQALAQLDSNFPYRLLVVSIDPKEQPPLALSKKRSSLARSRFTEQSPQARQWSFLTGSQASIDHLTQTIGFQYSYDSLSRTFRHPSGIVILTPSGKVSKYFFGTHFESQALRTALRIAEKEKSSSLVEQILVLCSHYDPTSTRIGQEILRVMRLAAGATALLVFFFLFKLHRREMRS